jgi:hypothetical protein
MPLNYALFTVKSDSSGAEPEDKGRELYIKYRTRGMPTSKILVTNSSSSIVVLLGYKTWPYFPPSVSQAMS